LISAATSKVVAKGIRQANTFVQSRSMAENQAQTRPYASFDENKDNKVKWIKMLIATLYKKVIYCNGILG
jgi:hypothetical protein